MSPPLRGPYFSAFESRLLNTPLSSAGSPSTTGIGSTSRCGVARPDLRVEHRGRSRGSPRSGRPARGAAGGRSRARRSSSASTSRRTRDGDADDRVEVAARVEVEPVARALADHRRVGLGHHERLEQLVRRHRGEVLELCRARARAPRRAPTVAAPRARAPRGARAASMRLLDRPIGCGVLGSLPARFSSLHASLLVARPASADVRSAFSAEPFALRSACGSHVLDLTPATSTVSRTMSPHASQRPHVGHGRSPERTGSLPRA